MQPELESMSIKFAKQGVIRINWLSWGGLRNATQAELSMWKYYGLWTVVITDRLVRLATDEVPPPRYFGPLHRLLGRWLLYRYRRPELAGGSAEYWTINPLTVMAWPFWRLWNWFENHIVFDIALRWLYDHEILVWPECEFWQYRRFFKALWFTKQAKELLAERAENAERDSAYLRAV